MHKVKTQRSGVLFVEEPCQEHGYLYARTWLCYNLDSERYMAESCAYWCLWWIQSKEVDVLILRGKVDGGMQLFASLETIQTVIVYYRVGKQSVLVVMLMLCLW